ncbi:bacteriohemerythrin [Maridesulfovibrio frigidus]|uniref:bacteriohemerythrin n=1 Tax=Maridesulfovibrio frigidus TaxID=340956 RepID=UPI0004E1586A|nr:bacteriohemerythrin [Maridesulfovibrio frigidus]
MPILTWKNDYSVGVKKIDDEHKTLIDMINKAYDSVEAMKEEEILAELVDEMRNYAMTHFATEEMYMKHHKYPHAETHRKQHNEFMIHVASTDNLLSSDKNEIDPIKVFKYLADWLRNHILITDKKFGAFLNEKGLE